MSKVVYCRVSFWLLSENSYISRVIGVYPKSPKVTLTDIIEALEKTYMIKRHCFRDVEFSEVNSVLR